MTLRPPVMTSHVSQLTNHWPGRRSWKFPNCLLRPPLHKSAQTNETIAECQVRMKSAFINEIPFDVIRRDKLELCVPNISYWEALEVLDYLDRQCSKLLLFWSGFNRVLHIKCLNEHHYTVCGMIVSIVCLFDDKNYGEAVHSSGSADILHANHIVYQPDSSFRVRLTSGRMRQCPNMVVEVRNNSLSVEEWVSKGQRYFEIDDIQLVLMVSIWSPEDVDDPNALLFFLMSRVAPGAGHASFALSDFRSFGVGPIGAETKNYFRTRLFPGHFNQFRGHGFPYNVPHAQQDGPCNARGLPLYTIAIPANRLLCQDNAGVVQTPNVVLPAGIAAPAPLQIDLRKIQEVVRW